MATGMLETIRPLEPGRGTKLPCNRAIYNFAPNTYGHYTCEVLKDEDYAAILSISAGYRPYDPGKDYPGLKLAPAAAVSSIPSSRTVQATPPPINPVKELAARKQTKLTTGTQGQTLAVDPANG